MVGRTQVVRYRAADRSVADKALAKAQPNPINDASVRIEWANSQRFRVLSQSAGSVVKVHFLIWLSTGTLTVRVRVSATSNSSSAAQANISDFD